MRVIIAALFVVSGMFAAVALVAVSGLGERAPVIVGLGLGVLLLLFGVLATYLFNPWWSKPLGLTTPQEVICQLEEKGLLESMDFQARRAFGVQEYDDEGLHYFLELLDGRVLYLGGQYLYEYDPIDDGGQHLPRRFPCTEFTVRRHKKGKHVVDIACKGTIIEPEFIALPLTRREWRLVGTLQDGQIVSDRPFDLLVELLQKPTGMGSQ